jgi:hypothetical protein
MGSEACNIQVRFASDETRPQAFCWRGNVVRVLCVEEVRTVGLERRYRVRTVQGVYELGLAAGGAWTLRRRPGWLARARASVRRMPRYPLPAGRRRIPRSQRPAPSVVPATSEPATASGNATLLQPSVAALIPVRLVARTLVARTR